MTEPTGPCPSSHPFRCPYGDGAWFETGPLLAAHIAQFHSEPSGGGGGEPPGGGSGGGIGDNPPPSGVPILGPVIDWIQGVIRSIDAKIESIEEVTLKKPGNKGFFGIGKKPNVYDVKMIEHALVEIKYKPKAKIRVKFDRSPDFWIQKLEKNDFRALTSLKKIEKSDSRFYTQYYDKAHDLNLTPLESAFPQSGPVSLDEQLKNIQETVQELLKFWNKPKISYSSSFEKLCALDDDEFRIHRIAGYSDGGRSVETMYVWRLGEDSFFSWARLMF